MSVISVLYSLLIALFIQFSSFAIGSTAPTNFLQTWLMTESCMSSGMRCFFASFRASFQVLSVHWFAAGMLRRLHSFRKSSLMILRTQ
jgi:hypothetical protein